MQLSPGILIVGLGGNNGVTLLAGQIANTQSLTWETLTGPVSSNWYGCLTQIPPRGVHGGVGFQGRIPGLASANTMKVGGWDIRGTKLGQALYDCRVLEPDLVRQVRETMDRVEIMEGVWDPSFIGESQHKTANHVVTGEDNKSTRTRLDRIRRDIRTWREKNKVDGHITVIWSASVERPSEAEYATADELLNAIYDDENSDDISPSMLYAAAAALEGCSFVNGGSQNTLSPAMSSLFDQCYRKPDAPASSALSNFAPYSAKEAYCLGTDYKAGQTKFKTAAVEYLRALGLTPRVIASSNHLGNNDMLNLTTKKTLNAKMRVKSDIFGPWQEEGLDHKVTVMYTPYIGDEKRDYVEYTSLGFLGSPHTMVTYTRCMDSILCVPLMVDAAIWCDYFVKNSVSPADAARATAYLFKVPEGGAKGQDPGFFHQMRQLEDVLEKTSGVGNGKKRKHEEVHDVIALGVSEGIISEEQAAQLRGLGSKYEGCT
jgi:myo-inositol-1-phosphate synthase